MIKPTSAIPEEYPLLLCEKNECAEGESCADSGSAARLVVAVARVKKKFK
jgi:hypothetical protein